MSRSRDDMVAEWIGQWEVGPGMKRRDFVAEVTPAAMRTIAGLRTSKIAWTLARDPFSGVSTASMAMSKPMFGHAERKFGIRSIPSRLAKDLPDFSFGPKSEEQSTLPALPAFRHWKMDVDYGRTGLDMRWISLGSAWRSLPDVVVVPDPILDAVEEFREEHPEWFEGDTAWTWNREGQGYDGPQG